jgi:HAE1 family hydrophobic/amphiphilic exporter-1
MLIGTIFGVILIPGLYVLFAGLTERRKKPPVESSPELVEESLVN